MTLGETKKDPISEEQKNDAMRLDNDLAKWEREVAEMNKDVTYKDG